MKPKKILMMLCAMFLFATISCKDSNEPEPFDEQILKEKLIGEWYEVFGHDEEGKPITIRERIYEDSAFNYTEWHTATFTNDSVFYDFYAHSYNRTDTVYHYEILKLCYQAISLDTILLSKMPGEHYPTSAPDERKEKIIFYTEDSLLIERFYPRYWAGPPPFPYPADHYNILLIRKK